MTIERERGKGLYPTLLAHIINENMERSYYMIIREDNIASQRGVAKVGFERFAIGEKNWLGQYVITAYL